MECNLVSLCVKLSIKIIIKIDCIKRSHWQCVVMMCIMLLVTWSDIFTKIIHDSLHEQQHKHWKILLSYCYNSSRICFTFAMTPKSIMKLNFLLSFVIHSVLTKDFFCFWNGYLQHQSEDIFHFHFIIIVKAFYCILMPWIRTSKSTIPLSSIHSLLLRYMGMKESRRLNH